MKFGNDLIFTIGIGNKYFELADNLAESLVFYGCKIEIIIITDFDATSKFAKILNVSDIGPRFDGKCLAWNRDKSSPHDINPILSKLYIDKFLDSKQYERITYIDADSLLTMKFKNFYWKIGHSTDIWASRINKKRSIKTCLAYFNCSRQVQVSDLVPALNMTKLELEELDKRPGVCGGFWSYRPDTSPDFLEMMREAYHQHQPCTDQEVLNYLLATNKIKCQIKDDIFFSDPQRAGQGLIHFTHHKKEALRLMKRIKSSS